MDVFEINSVVPFCAIYIQNKRRILIAFFEGSGTLLVRLYKDAGTPSTECLLTDQILKGSKIAFNGSIYLI